MKGDLSVPEINSNSLNVVHACTKIRTNACASIQLTSTLLSDMRLYSNFCSAFTMPLSMSSLDTLSLCANSNEGSMSEPHRVVSRTAFTSRDF